MEKIWELIWKGFGIWRRNLNLSIPFLYSIVALVLVDVSFSIFLPAADIPLVFTDGYSDSYSHLDIILGWILLLAAITISLSFRLFFDIGAIGMARQALKEGRSDTSRMWSTAKRHFWNMFVLSFLNGLIIGLAMLIGSILIHVVVQLAGAVPEISDSFDRTGIIIYLYIVIVFRIIMVFVLLFTHLQAALVSSALVSPDLMFALILSVILSPAPYALVLEEQGPVQAIRAGVDFFKGNKLDVLVLNLVRTTLNLLILQIILQMDSLHNESALSIILLFATVLADLLILAPLTNLWWTRLYMVRKGMLNSEELKAILSK